MITLTGEILKKICPTLSIDKAKLLSDLFKSVCPKYGIDNNNIFHEFIANVAHESGQFSLMSESLNYKSTALILLFGRHRITVEQANLYGHTSKQKANQKQIGNILYGGKWGKNNLGNTLPNDGYNFRGGGYIQITGRGNYQKFTNYYNKLNNTTYTIEQVAELVRTNDLVSIHSACWVFAIAKKLIDEAIENDIKDIVKSINGGFIGMPERLKYYELAKNNLA